MFGQSDSDDYQPFGYVGGVALFLTTILIVVYSVAMIALALTRTGNLISIPYMLIFDAESVRHFQFWRFVTYPLVNGPSIWFALEMYLLYVFGRDVERFVGRSAFGMLYLSLVLLGPCLVMAVGVFSPGFDPLLDSRNVNFGVFIAFCTIYPNAEVFLSIKAKWLAAIICGIDFLFLLSAHAFGDLFIFVASCLGGFLFIKYLRGHLKFSLGDYIRERRSRRSLRPLPKASGSIAEKAASPRDNVIESINPLLDKIAKHGIASLTDRERERLEQASAELLKKPES